MRLKGGFTNNVVIKRGDVVVKTGEKVGNEAFWYAHYEDKNDLPKVIEWSEKVLKIEFLEAKRALNVPEIIGLVYKYSEYDPINHLDYSNYIDRIQFHLQNQNLANGEKLISKLKEQDLENTFAHGDLSTRNIIVTDRPKLIDPLYFDNFGSYILDLAKFAFSLKFYDFELNKYNQLRSFVDLPDCFIASECVRVATYNKRFSFIAENLINEL